MATDKACAIPWICDDFRIKLRGDPQFENVKKVFLAKGRERRPDLQPLQPNNKLLLQLLMLKEEGEKSLDETADFMLQICPELPHQRLRYLVTSVRKRWDRLKDCEAKNHFLTEEFDITGVGPHLKECGMTRLRLLKGECELDSLQFPSNGLLLDVKSFRKQEGATLDEMSKWWYQLTGETVTAMEMKKRASKTADRKNRVVGLKRGGLAEFMATSCSPSSSVTVDNSGQQCSSNSGGDAGSSTLKLCEQGKELACLRRRLQDVETDNNTLHLQYKTALECSHEANQQLRAKTLIQSANELELDKLRQQFVKVVEERDAINTRLQYYLKGSHKRKIQRQHQKLATLNQRLETAVALATARHQQRDEYKRKFRRLQMVHANVKRKLQRAVRRMEKLRTDFQDPQPKPQEDGEMVIIRLKDEGGFFTKGVKVCIMDY